MSAVQWVSHKRSWTRHTTPDVDWTDPLVRIEVGTFAPKYCVDGTTLPTLLITDHLTKGV